MSLGNPRVLLPAQIRAARALLGISQAELADLAQVGSATIKRIEVAQGRLRGAAETFRRLENALRAQGIEFIAAEAGRGPGVRFAAPLIQNG